MGARALLVVDEASLRATTARSLAGGGISVVTGRMDDDVDFDVLVLDGLDVCRQWRERSGVPIVMLSRRGAVRDVVAALDLGADDYVVMPCDDAELLARVRAAIRRMAPQRYGDLVVDPRTFRIELRGRAVDLTTTELRLVLELARNSHRVMSRQMLLDRVWGCDYLGDSRLVDMAIKRLRHKLGDEAHDPCYIVTVRGEGYRFCASPSSVSSSSSLSRAGGASSNSAISAPVSWMSLLDS